MSNPFDPSLPPAPRPPQNPVPPPPPGPQVPPVPSSPFASPQPSGPATGFPGAPYDFGPLPSSRPSRSGKATTAFVLGLASILLFVTLVVPLLALIFGLIALSEVKRSQGRLTGKGMATTGVVLGILGLIGGVVLIVAAINKAVDEATTSIEDLEVGHCYNLPLADTVTVVDIEEVDCSDGHKAEVIYVGRLDPDQERDYPGEDNVQAEASLECVRDRWTDYLGTPYPSGGEYELFTLYPQQFTWRGTRGAFACLVVDPEFDDLIGSVAD